MYNAKQIAEFFLARYGSTGSITPMKLIKLVYIAYGWYLGLTGSKLFQENPEAWKYGPVIPTIYKEFKAFRNAPIMWINNAEYTTGDETTDSFLDRIWSVYGSYTGTQLSAKTHMPGTPWFKAWNDVKNHNKVSLQMDHQEIERHYRQLAAGDVNQ
ncbi:Panacea domain-containing protein [Sphingobacterium paludis]|uniref:Putative phage-associated protein n=1 Tax=Sphingobacterium paludis TaxID=1476465 RepID=A0A4R7D1A1_9SPHI|nr:type II toxin-antitoxin system antitoxin SocA domain-containing protein [Sphingobacterium paludis]TDS14739.1 putative phage-associated protein [Sphingobacterium paludis]